MHAPRRAVLTTAAIALGATAVVLVSIHEPGAERVANQSVSGELVRYERSSRRLTLRTAEGDHALDVEDDTPVHEGVRTVALTDLTTAVGCRAKVWYRNAQGHRKVNEIRISCLALTSPGGTAPDQRQP